ncbi:hypothetical protein PT974_08571 [Cladobotryum mycophilum]|uniref:Glycoprotease family protein n=1 Tax=Cladobotryum mycophilum TaxID=491253 RepID=A0ABR0SEB9_9HYPO
MSKVHGVQQDHLLLPSSTFQSTQRPSDPLKKDMENQPGAENSQKDIAGVPSTKPSLANDDCVLITFATEEPVGVATANHMVTKENLPRKETDLPSSTHVKMISEQSSSSNTQPEREIATVSKPILIHVQAPIVRIPTPRLIVPQTSSGRSTPTLRIPTPRRTPSPAANVPPTQAPYESLARYNPENALGIQEKARPLSIDHIPADVPPPYSPPKKQLAVLVRYQAVFPPDHPINTHFPPNRTGSPGLASTMTSQGPGRKVEDPSAKPAEKSVGENIKMIPILPVASNVPRENPQNVALSSQPSKTVIIQNTEQSRFSLSPVSPADTTTSDDDLRSVERYIMPARNQSSPFPAQPVERHADDQFYDLERLPTNPARAYLAHEPVAAPPNLSGGAGQSGGYVYTTPLPIRPMGTYLPEEHAHSAQGRAHKVERERRRHEKEDVAARRAGGFWRGRGCVPARGCFGRTGREGRKKRRIWMSVIAVIIAIIILAIVLALMLTKHHGTHEAHSIWVNLTDYPPMPTGVLTFVGPDNTVAKSGCTEPSTLWSCSLPKDDQDSVAPYKPNQPTVVFQIQWDNSTSKGWKVQNGDAPAPISRRGIRRRDTIDGFQSNPSPPSFKEMWFLGETTDDVKSSEKAGEPAPFFISILSSVNATVNSPTLTRKRGLTGGNDTLAGLLPSPDLEADGTPKPAVMIPQPVQQPVRLYDRGLPTEHYGFYTYFKRTIYLKSVTVLNQTEGNVPLDEDGGSRKNEANYLVTWAQTRMLVQIWTRQLDGNTTSLLKPSTDGGINNSTQLIRPGTMPYPVTLTLDTHGGNPKEKVVWDWPMDSRQKLSVNKAELLANNMAAGGTWINHRGSGDAKFGGFDGGSGGCKCQWVNFV